MSTAPYDRAIYNGLLLDNFTIAFLKDVQAHIKIGAWYQGSYQGGVSASAGTHDGGGAVDVYGSDPNGIVWEMRRLGGAAWVRNPSQGPWPWHIHVIVQGNTQVSPAAADQITYYRQGLDGLAGHGPDYHRRPDPLVLKYDYHQEDDMQPADFDHIAQIVENKLKPMEHHLAEFRKNLVERDVATRNAILAAIDAAPDGLSKADLRALVAHQLDKSAVRNA